MSIPGTQGQQLRNNPFFVLNVSCSADRRTIVAAADERSFFEDADKCVEAQNALLNPAKRLSAELDWFPDTDEENIVWIKQSIESGGRISVGEFGTVSQLNAELYNLGFFDMTQPQQLARFERTLCSVDRLYSRLDGKEIAQMLNQHRKTAHLAEVSVQEVEQELIQKRYRIRRVLSGCLEKMSDEDCTEKVLKIAQTYIEDNKGNPGVVLLDFVSQYELRIQPKIDALVEKIDAKINFCKIRTGGVLDSALDELIKEVAAWATIVNPMMICGKANGRSHEGTSAMGNKLRNLALYLHNEKEQTAAAAKLTEAMLGIFTYDRMFHNKLTEEVKTLKKLSSQRQSAESLKEEIDQVMELINTVEKWNPLDVVENMKDLAFSLNLLNKKLNELAREDRELDKLREILALAARTVAVVMHNKYQQTKTALNFVDFLLQLFSDIDSVRRKLHDDRNALNRQVGAGMDRFMISGMSFSQIASESSDKWLLNRGKEYQAQKKYSQAFRYYKRAADMGNAEAINFVGFCFDMGYGVVKNKEEALIWYHKAVEKGNATAAYNISHAYEVGQGVPKDEAEAFRWAEKAAELGHRDAATYVARCYLDGRKVKRNCEQAIRFFEKGANQGSTICMCQLAGMYDHGEGIVVNKERALYWYAKAADNGDPSACVFAAQMYEQGEGTTKDPEKAKKYYLIGSNTGSSSCTVSAALLYAESTDNASLRESFRLCNLAIEQGSRDPRIYRLLGMVYMNGQGTEKSYEKAREMFLLAKDEEGLQCLDERIQAEKTAEISRMKKWKKLAAVATLLVLCASMLFGIVGLSAYKKGDYETAVGYLCYSFIGRNEYSEALCYYGDALLNQGDFEAAYDCFERVSDPPTKKLCYSRALTLIHDFDGYLSDSELEEIQNNLDECENFMNAAKYRSIIQAIAQKRYGEAVRNVEELPEKSNDGMQRQTWKEILLSCVTTRYSDDLEVALNQLYLKMHLDNPGKKYPSTELKTLINSKENAEVIYSKTDKEIRVSSEGEVIKQCGSAYDKKILIIKTVKSYGMKEDTLICLDLMEFLPKEYIPSSLDEVEFVITLEYDFVVDGTYTHGTKALQEYAYVEVDSLSNNKQNIFRKKVMGDSPPYFFSSTGILSCKSGGSPDVYQEFLEALKIAIN